MREGVFSVVEFSIQLGDQIPRGSDLRIELLEQQGSVRAGEDAVAK